MHQILLDGTSQTLRHVPAGYVSAATYALETLSYSIGDASRTLSSGACTVASWSLTTNASAGPTASNTRRISVTATTGAAVGAPAAIIATDGTFDIFEVAAVGSGYLEAVGPLPTTYASGSAVKGILITAAVDDADAADETLLRQQHPIRIAWSYTLAGVVHKIVEPVEFVRHKTAGLDVGQALLSLGVLYPDLPTRLPDGARWVPYVSELTRSIRVDLRARNIDPEQWLTGDAGLELLIARVVEHAAASGWCPGNSDHTEFTRLAHARYRERLEALTVGVAGKGVIATSIETDTSPSNPDQRNRGPFLPA